MYSRLNINEAVSVHSFSNHHTFVAGPVAIQWRGRSYRITNVGIHHTIREGRTLCHIFSVTDGSTYFKIKYDTETLMWQLLEIATQ